MSFLMMVLAVVALVFLAGAAIYVMGGSKKDEPSWDRKPGSVDRGTPASGPSAASARKFNWLIGKTRDVEGKSFHVGKRTATIGRGIGNFIQISDENSSRVHAQFKGAAAGLKIKDMESSNGTKVNGEELEPGEFRRLEDGDEVTIGDTTFVYHREGEFRDTALTGSKDVKASQQKRTQALGAVGGAADLTSQVKEAVERHGGDVQKAADEVGLDPELVERIVNAERS